MLRNMKIKNKLILAFTTIAIIASVSSIASVFIIRTMDKNYSMALTEYGFAQGDIGKAMLIITDNRRLARDIINCEKPENIAEFQKRLEENREKYKTYAADVETSLVSDEAKEIYSEIQKHLAEYAKMQDEFINLGLQATPEEKVQLRQRIFDELDPVFDQLYDDYKQIMEIKVNLGDELSTTLTKGSAATVLFVIIAIIAAIAVSVTLGTVISRKISEPIKKCSERLNLLSKGDLKSPVPERVSNDETGVLVQSTKRIVDTMVGIISDMTGGLESMGRGDFTVESSQEALYVGDYRPLFDAICTIIKELSLTLVQIHRSSDQVEVGSNHVADASQALSQGATEQASSVEELSASISDISNDIKQNAQSAEIAKERTEKVSGEITASDSQMQEMISAMNHISEKSIEISKIIKTIDDIAFQTNILALNAAVEAARAGEAGKGFAVVADEVRNLAGKSAEAAKSTAVLIEETVSAVEQGALMADNTAKSMVMVVEDAKVVAQLIEQITDASNEQAAFISQVTTAVEQISSVIQNNAATAEESAAASEELNSQAVEMKQLMAHFKVNENI